MLTQEQLKAEVERLTATLQQAKDQMHELGQLIYRLLTASETAVPNPANETTDPRMGLLTCPDCGSNEVTGSQPDIEEPLAFSHDSCGVCGCEWDTFYKFFTYNVTSHGSTWREQ